MNPDEKERRGFPLPDGVVAGDDWKDWTDLGCPVCGNPEFSIPAATEVHDDEDND
jgi:hypothetical protein